MSELKVRRQSSGELNKKIVNASTEQSLPKSPQAKRKKGKKRHFPHAPAPRDSLINTLKIIHKDKTPLDVLQSEDMQGLVNLGFLILIAATIQVIVSNYMNYGILVDLKFLICLSDDFGSAFLLWMVILSGSFMSYIIEIARVHNIISEKNSELIHYASLIAIFVIPINIIFTFEMAPIVSAPVAMVMVILSMKMHSYYATNKVYRSEISNVDEGPEDEPSELERINYPSNVTLFNYIYFLCAPTLVYEIQYPRTANIRRLYALKEFLQMCGCLVIAYIALVQFILPVIREDKYFVFYDLIRLAIPSIIVWLIGFYALFHCFLNSLSELMRFADRQFYLDWWNAQTIGEFWRKWNLLVHEWLLRHVYFQSLKSGSSKKTAVLLTFFVSALMHEFVFWVAFQVMRPWFFLGMFVQVPLIMMSQYLVALLPPKDAKRWGNIFVWCALFLGQPLILLLYIREWFWVHSDFFCTDSSDSVFKFLQPKL